MHTNHFDLVEEVNATFEKIDALQQKLNYARTVCTEQLDQLILDREQSNLDEQRLNLVAYAEQFAASN